MGSRKYLLDKTIKYAVIAQLIATIYAIGKTVGKGSQVYVNGIQQSMATAIFFYVIQAAVSLLLLLTLLNNPKRLKAWLVLISVFFTGQVGFRTQNGFSFSFFIDWLGLIFFIISIWLVISTHRYMRGKKSGS